MFVLTTPLGEYYVWLVCGQDDIFIDSFYITVFQFWDILNNTYILVIFVASMKIIKALL